MHFEPETNPQTLKNRAINFLSGSTVGALVVLVPLSYFWYFTPDAVQPVHFMGAAAFIGGCGMLAAVLNGKFLQILSSLLDSLPSL